MSFRAPIISQDWFTEGMDDTAAVLGKFVMILKSGSFVLKSESLEVTLSLQYLRSTESEGNVETMTQDKLVDFVQHLGFANHASDSSLDSEVFIRMYSDLVKVRDTYQQLIGVGYRAFFEPVNLSVSSPNSPIKIEEMLNSSHREFEGCESWLKQLRSKYKYSLLFHIDELHYIYQSLREARSVGEGIDARNSDIAKIVESMSRLSPEVAQHPHCPEIVIRYIRNTLPEMEEMSWLEDGTLLHP
jgi:hypothetical protein